MCFKCIHPGGFRGSSYFWNSPTATSFSKTASLFFSSGYFSPELPQFGFLLFPTALAATLPLKLLAKVHRTLRKITADTNARVTTPRRLTSNVIARCTLLFCPKRSANKQRSEQIASTKRFVVAYSRLRFNCTSTVSFLFQTTVESFKPTFYQRKRGLMV